MRNKSEFSKLVGRLTKPGSSAAGGAPSQAELLPSSSSASSLGSMRTNELRSESVSSSGIHNSGLQFGSPSRATTTSSQGTSEWARLLQQTASGGISSAFGGGLLSAVGGLGGLIPAIAGLFGGSSRKTLPPLQLFQLPAAQNQEITVGSQAAANSQPGPIYSATTASQNSPVAINLAESAHVAQVVKLALLNSSSLNDVIAEI